MKYVLYVDYRAGHQPACEYRKMEAKTPIEAILEADSLFDPKEMYLIRIMEKVGRVEKVKSDVKAQTYEAKYEKRSIRWTEYEGNHQKLHYMAKGYDWF